MKLHHTFKKDKYWEARGRYARLLAIHCRKCKDLICIYQKDGPGNLRRLYLDRIVHPKNLAALRDKQLKKIILLKCKNCNEILGTHYEYKKEKRKAFRLYQDAVSKEIKMLASS